MKVILKVVGDNIEDQEILENGFDYFYKRVVNINRNEKTSCENDHLSFAYIGVSKSRKDKYKRC